MVNNKIIVALSLLLLLAAPLSTFAESFTVTTNKDIYTSDEKAIIVGAVPEDAPDGYAVLITVTGREGNCASLHLLPGSDNTFISRAIKLNECGFGEFTISATYGDEKTTSRFTISNSSRADAGNKIELRTLKNVLLQAQDAVNTRVKELIESGYVLPEEVARKYGEGVTEASLALQAIESENSVEAKKHMLLAIQDFREVWEELYEQNVARFEQATEQKTANGGSDAIGTYNILKRKFDRYQELAQKNNVDNADKFEAAALLLSNARQMLDDDRYTDGQTILEQVNAILEEIRTSLYKNNGTNDAPESNSGENNDNTSSNSTSSDQ